MADTPREINVRLAISGEEALLLHAAELDLRRQEQIKRQGASISRLLMQAGVPLPDINPAVDEIKLLNEQLAYEDSKLRLVRDKVVELLAGLSTTEAWHIVRIQEVVAELGRGLEIDVDKIGEEEQKRVETARAKRHYSIGKKSE